jgi:antitoxin (DNA-binding transcriptional repressor) of toxin-antitoxin stability system
MPQPIVLNPKQNLPTPKLLSIKNKIMQITKTQLKAQLEELLERLDLENEDIIIMDGGKPVFKLSKYEASPSTEELFAPLRGKVKYYEDLTTPTTEEWSEL